MIINCALKGHDKIELRATLRYHSGILFRQSKFKTGYLAGAVQAPSRFSVTHLKQNDVSGSW